MRGSKVNLLGEYNLRWIVSRALIHLRIEIDRDAMEAIGENDTIDRSSSPATARDLRRASLVFSWP